MKQFKMSEHNDNPESLVSLLRHFNRKERYWLLNDALGSPPISNDYLKHLATTLGIAVPEGNVWWAMDYHFDWLHAALLCFERGCTIDSLSEPQSNVANDADSTQKETYIKGNQRDIDLIIAFEQTLLLIEAKGDGAWSQRQMKRKAERIKALPRPKNLNIRLVLTSHHNATHIINGDWRNDIPEGMLHNGQPILLELSNFGGGVPLYRVTRCNGKGESDAKGTYWCTQKCNSLP